MPTYVVLSQLTDKGAKSLKRRGKRLTEVNEELAKGGVKVVAQYALLGPYDFVTILEAEDNIAAANVSADFASRGTIKMTTLPAIEIDEFIASLG